jgi:hypothetical protein
MKDNVMETQDIIKHLEEQCGNVFIRCETVGGTRLILLYQYILSYHDESPSSTLVVYSNRTTTKSFSVSLSPSDFGDIMHYAHFRWIGGSVDRAIRNIPAKKSKDVPISSRYSILVI